MSYLELTNKQTNRQMDRFFGEGNY